MRYQPDLSRLPLSDCRELLRKQNLLPSRRPLLDGLDEKFARLQAQGIASVADLLHALSSPTKIADLAAKSGVSTDYLALLKREAGTLKLKPVSLLDFPDMDSALIDALYANGIKTSKDYFEAADDTAGELYALCDLVRINGVGPYAAKLFFEAGYRSAKAVAGADAQTMLGRVTAVNEARQYYQGKLGEKDMQFCIDSADILLRLGE